MLDTGLDISAKTVRDLVQVLARVTSAALAMIHLAVASRFILRGVEAEPLDCSVAVELGLDSLRVHRINFLEVELHQVRQLDGELKVPEQHTLSLIQGVGASNSISSESAEEPVPVDRELAPRQVFDRL